MTKPKSAGALLILLLLAACARAPQADLGIAANSISWFEGTIDEAFSVAKTESRPLFLYWGAEWCPPCHYLKNKIFKEPEFLARIVDFVPVYLDGDTERAQILGEQLDVQGYPTVVVFTPDGEEVMRMASNIPVAHYADVLDAAVQVMRPVDRVLVSVLATGAADAPRTDLNLLAFYSWDQDSKSGLPEEEKLATFESLYLETPEELPVQRSRFFSLYLSELLNRQRQSDGEELLSPAIRADLDQEMLRILQDRDLRNANLFPLTYMSSRIVDLLQPEPSPGRDQLISAWRAAARESEDDTSLSLDDRLSALAPQIALAKLELEDDASGGNGEPLPEDLVQRVRDRVAWAAETVGDEGELQAVMSTMVWLLQSVDLQAEAETLLSEKMDETLAPYYFMSWLASVKKDADKPTEALLWYRKAYDSARGRYTRFRWGSTYLRRLLEIAPDDVETIEVASFEILDELLTHDDAFSLGNHSRLGSVGKAYDSWNEDGDHDEVLARIAEHVHSACERYPDDGEDSQRRRCLAFLAG